MSIDNRFQNYMSQDSQKAGAAVTYEDGAGGAGGAGGSGGSMGGAPANNIGSGNIAGRDIGLFFRKRHLQRLKEIARTWQQAAMK
jgi:hypothetical protein